MSHSTVGSVGHRAPSPRWWKRARRVALVVAAGWCIVLGIGVTATLAAEGALARVGTPTLMAAAGMLILPGLTALALRLDSRERRRMDLAKGKLVTSVVSHAAHADSAPRREAPAHRARSTPGRLAGDRVA